MSVCRLSLNFDYGDSFISTFQLSTGEDQMVVMSRDFEVIYEAPLRTEDYGEGKLMADRPYLSIPVLILILPSVRSRRDDQCRLGVQTNTIPWVSRKVCCPGGSISFTYRQSFGSRTSNHFVEGRRSLFLHQFFRPLLRFVVEAR